MDYADSFTPKPIKGEKYTTTDGKIVVVDDIQPDEGVVYVFCHYEGDEPYTMSPNKEEWEAMFSHVDDTKYSIKLSANPLEGGTVTGEGLYDKDSKVVLSAIPSNGYIFVKWSDNDSQPQRNIVVSTDLQLEAIFKQISTGTSTDGGSSIGSQPIGGTGTSNTPNNSQINSGKAENIEDSSNKDENLGEYLEKVIEPIKRLKILLRNGITLPFQILKLESDEEIPAQFSDPNVTKTCQDEINKIEALRKEGENVENRGSWVEEKMWSFGAFDKPMLRMFKQDHGAKTGLGAAIFMTSLLAFCTGTYAFYKISNNTFLAFVFGLIWGTMIYVLDRNIVASMAYTGEKHKIKKFFKTCGSVCLRLFISVCIGMVISTPIEMLIFGGKIEEYKNFEHEQFVKNEIESYHDEISKDLYEKKARIETELATIRSRMDGEEKNPYAKGRGKQWESYRVQEIAVSKRDSNMQKELDQLPLIYETKHKEFLEKAEKKWKQQEDYFDLSTDLAILYKVTSTIEELDKIAERENNKSVKSSNLIKQVIKASKDTKSTDRQQSASLAKQNTKVSKDENNNISSKGSPQNTESFVANQNKNEAIINPALPKDNMMHNCRVFITFFFILLEVIPVLTKLFFKAGEYDKEMVRWSYLKSKLHRIENASSYNQTLNGALSTHRKYILGDEFEEIEKTLLSDENQEKDNKDDLDNITLPIKGCLRTAQDYNDWRNLRRWKFAIMKADDYLEEEINKLFSQQGSTSKFSQPPQNHSAPSDPSAGGEVID